MKDRLRISENQDGRNMTEERIDTRALPTAMDIHEVLRRSFRKPDAPAAVWCQERIAEA